LSAIRRRFLATLAERQQSLQQLVRQVGATATAAASRDSSLAATIHALPTALREVRSVVGSLVPFGDVATPVLANLAIGARVLTPTLAELGPASQSGRELLALLPPLVKQADPLLGQLRRFSVAAPPLTRGLPPLLCELNPVLSYLVPYQREVGAFFGNVGMSNDAADQLGRNPITVFPTVDTNSVRFKDSLPTKLTEKLMGALGVPYSPMKYNPYPRPGTVAAPQPFDGNVPTVPSMCKA